ncbi:MAG: AraC family transcriptional regulator [Muricauda sp.]|nr:AraC family transcriptional regulator [Allomuricauda sp.]
MMHINIPALTAKDFVEIISRELQQEMEVDNREFCFSLSDFHGHGYIKAFDFDYGLSVYEFDCTFEQSLAITLAKEVVQPLLILFNREEPIAHTFRDSEYNEVNRLESLMVCAGTDFTNTFRFEPGKSVCFLMMAINRKEFEEKIDAFLKEMDNSLETIFKDVNGITQLYQKGHYSLDIAKFIEEFTTTELSGFMRHVFLEGKAYEILIHFLRQYREDAQDPTNRKILRQSTVEKIERASEIIESELDSLGSIMSLAKKVGLNQNTLQEGFKKLYNKSVNQYIKDVRLEKAQDLMESTDLNITEITYRLGINSRSYFSKLFKERFGVTPKDYMNKRRKPDNSNLSA